MRIGTLLLLAATAICPATGCESEKAGGCPQSIAAYCNAHGCGTWAEVQAAPPACTALGSGEFEGMCGDYNVDEPYVTFDVATFYYYDRATGTLVAVVGAPRNPGECVAGPAAGFDTSNLSCETWTPRCGAVDAGTGDAADGP